MLKTIFALSDGTQISSGAASEVSIKSCTVTECVNSGVELVPGSTCCACLEAQVITTGQKLGLTTGDLIELVKVDDAGTEAHLGVFCLEAPTKKSDNIYKLTAYDNVSKLDKDLTEWLKGLTDWPYSLITFAGMVCDACGLRLVTTEIPNGDFPVQQLFKSGVTGRQIMQWIGEIACRFCRANAYGNIEFGWYTSSGVTIQPGGERYYYAGALSYEDYDVATIDAVQLRLANSERGALWPEVDVDVGTVTYDFLNIRSGAGTGYDLVGQLSKGDKVQIYEQQTIDEMVWGRTAKGWICLTGYVEMSTEAASNPYVIAGNAILLAKVTEDLPPYLNVIRDELTKLPAYRPCKVSLPAGGDIRPGHTVQIVDKHGNRFTTCVMTKTQTGQRDTLECTGSARRDSSTAVNNQSAVQIAQQEAQQAVDGQTQEDIFNKLTNYGAIQGIYVQDGKWYINVELVQLVNLVAELITAGTLKSKDGRTYFNLDTGKIVSTTESGRSVVVHNGNILVLDPEENERVWITQDDDFSYIYLCDGDKKICGGVGVGFGHFQIMAPENTLEGQGAGYPVVWKEINGVKVLCASS